MENHNDAERHERAGKRLEHDRELTALESSQVRKLREMVKHMVLARTYFEDGDRAGYLICLNQAADLANSIKREIDQLLRAYRIDLLDDLS